ncbi:hypothetical protein AAAU47_01630, partial [Hominilimicola fabiformis]
RKEIITGKKLSKFEKFKANAEEVLRLSNTKMTWEQFELLDVLCIAVGVVIGLIFNNVILSVIMGGIMAYMPLVVLKMKQHKYSVYLNEQLQSALNTVTTAYLKNDDINLAVKENLHRIDEPLNTIFREFIAMNTFIDSDIVKNIKIMKEKINNGYFHEWCDYLMLSQKDRNMKYVLLTIVSEISEAKNMQQELNTAMFNIYKEFAMVAGLVIFIVPGVKLLNTDWYGYLVNTGVGKFVVALSYLVTFLSFIHVVKVTQPTNEM